jgi:hypothetical protein
MAQHTAVLQCIGDTYVDKNNPNTNYGGSTVLLCGGNLGGTGYSARTAIYFQFKMPADIKNKRIIKGILKAYLNSLSDNLEVRVGIFATDESYTEYNITAAKVDFGFGCAPNGGVVDLQQGLSGMIDFPITADIGGRSFKNNALVWLCMKPGEFYYGIGQFCSREGSNKPTLEIVYEDVPPDKPTQIEPIGRYLDNTNSIKFEWKYNSSVGGEQKKFDLYWSADGGKTWNTISETTANNFYNMPANTLPSGNIIWKIRTYNEYDEVSPESDISVFYAIGKPQTPIVSINNSARPTIMWNSKSQQIYQVQILKDNNIIYDTGNIPSLTVNSHKVKSFLNDGEYQARVRTKNEYNLYSDWGITNFTIATNKPTKPSLNVYSINYGIFLEINPIENVDYILIYRSQANKNDYKCIGKVEGIVFEDYSAANRELYQYFVRAVATDESFSNSDVKTGKIAFSGNTIAVASNLKDFIQLKYSLESKPENPVRISTLGDVVYFDGRTHGSFEYSEFEDKNKNLTFFIKSKNEVSKLIDFIKRKETLLYRDNDGDRIFGTVNNLEVLNKIGGYAINFNIMQNDYKEEMEV